MLNFNHKSISTGLELDASEIDNLINLALELKKDRLKYKNLFANKQLALIFDKPSLRTRFSFTTAMRELGGDVIDSINTSRKSETPEDQIRVLQGYCHAVMIRTFEDETVNRMISVSKIPVINGLSNNHHPCQTFADLMTLKERFEKLSGLTVAYLGDGNNILHSLLLLAPKLGVNIYYCCPEKYQPKAEIVKQAKALSSLGEIKSFSNPAECVKNVDAIYTDVWTSMGFDEVDKKAFQGFKVDEKLMSKAKPHAIFMHCMPMNRDEEVSETLPDLPCSAIFEQSENRMHVQKALLIGLMSE